MKLSKSLLSTIMVAVTVSTITSCTKDDADLEKQKKEAEKSKTEKVIDNCPACGMG
jgi:hypothetical protein